MVVSNDAANAAADLLGRGVITIVPLTSRTDRVLPFQVLLPAARVGLRQDSKAQAHQVRAVAVDRLAHRPSSRTFPRTCSTTSTPRSACTCPCSAQRWRPRARR